MKLVIDDVDLSHYCTIDSIQPGDSAMGATIGTGSARLEDWSGTIPKVPALGMEVKIYDEDGVTLIFGGQVSEMQLTNLAGRGRVWDLYIQDWNESLVNAYVQTSSLTLHPSPWTDRDIVLDIIQNGLDRSTLSGTPTFTNQTSDGTPWHPISVANGAFGARPWPKVKVNVVWNVGIPFDWAAMTVKAALDKLASFVPGLYYRVGADKIFTWSVPGLSEAPFILSTSPQGTLAYPFEAYAEVWIRGDHGNRTRFNSQYAFEEVSFAEAGGTAKGAIRDIPYTSDASITTFNEIKQRAFAQLAHASRRRTITLTTRQPGLKVGMLLSIVNGNFGTGTKQTPGFHGAGFAPFAGIGGMSNSEQLSNSRGTFVILKTRDTPLGNGAHKYEITCGDYVRDLGAVLA
jgi:hypothetical protein